MCHRAKCHAGRGREGRGCMGAFLREPGDALFCMTGPQERH